MQKEQRCQQIEKDNRLLYKKMLSIHNKPLKVEERREFKNLESAKVNIRQNASKRIMEDNQSFLKRLNQQKPSLNFSSFEKDRQKQEERIQNLS